MKLISFTAAGRSSYGVVLGDRIVDLRRRLGERYPTLRTATAGGALGGAAADVKGATPDIALSQVSLLPPITDPDKIICAGRNYRAHAAEAGGPPPENPSVFLRLVNTLVAHDQPMVCPKISGDFDYEGELALIIGKAGRHIAESAALDHIAAVTLCNEGTIRDWVRHAKFNVTQGKNFDSTGSLGPWIVPYMNESQIADIRLTTRVNGETRQDDRTSRLIFGFRYLINYIATFTTLVPGDVIVTGTPTGAGARFDPPRYLKPGDIIEVEADGVGLLRNGVVDET
jgi:2-keto-4-pentenoate hydratase/2-oxohepta-3-ene-1,7-dioic acid hydratase in catechol pathway